MRLKYEPVAVPTHISARIEHAPGLVPEGGVALAREELFGAVHEAELVAELLIAGAGARAQLLVGVREDAPARRAVSLLFFFFFTLVTGPRRSLCLKLSDTRVYEPQIRARSRAAFARRAVSFGRGWDRGSRDGAHGACRDRHGGGGGEGDTHRHRHRHRDRDRHKACCLCSHTSFCRMDARLRGAWHQGGGTHIVCMGHCVADPCLQRLVLYSGCFGTSCTQPWVSMQTEASNLRGQQMPSPTTLTIRQWKARLAVRGWVWGALTAFHRLKISGQ